MKLLLKLLRATLCLCIAAVLILTSLSCGGEPEEPGTTPTPSNSDKTEPTPKPTPAEPTPDPEPEPEPEPTPKPEPIVKQEKLTSDFYFSSYEGDNELDNFLKVGAAGEAALTKYILAWLSGRPTASTDSDPESDGIGFACSTITAKNADGEALFGRNLDWAKSDGMILVNKPTDGGDYCSISTINTAIVAACGLGFYSMSLENRLKAALYFPLDGMNEKGFTIAVNMIKDPSVSAHQTAPGKTPINFTSAIRLLLNRAATVDEAIALLGNYSMSIPAGGQLFHFAMADRTGKSVVVEYINGQIYVTDTPAVTNFYLTPNKVSGTEKYGIGTNQSMERYQTLLTKLEAAENEKGEAILDAEGVREALSSVAKSNFNVPGSSTEWSVVFNLATCEVTYYRRENWSAPISYRVPGTGQDA